MNKNKIRPQPRPNAISEEAGVDATRRIFRANGWIFQEVEERNDFGKDAYVDLPEEDGITGITLALQIKSGPSFKRKDGYRIPIKQHRLTWIESTVPVFGIVHDQDTENLYWVNITQYLRDRIDTDVRQVFIPYSQILNSITLNADFRDAAYKAWDITQGAVFLLNLVHSDSSIQLSAVHDCIALAQHEPRFILLLRGCLKYLKGDALRATLYFFGHFVPSRRIQVDSLNWIRKVSKSIRSLVYLDEEEIVSIMDKMEEDDWIGGESVNELLWLVIDDADGMLKLKHALEYSIEKNMNRAAEGILEIICFLAGEDGLERYYEVIESIPKVTNLPRTQELAQHLEENGYIYFFSFMLDDLIRDAGRISKIWPIP